MQSHNPQYIIGFFSSVWNRLWCSWVLFAAIRYFLHSLVCLSVCLNLLIVSLCVCFIVCLSVCLSSDAVWDSLSVFICETECLSAFMRDTVCLSLSFLSELHVILCV